jgi:glucose-1-phosphate adenylyltransferase
MDYGDMLAAHEKSGADMSVCCMEVPLAEAAGAFGVMEVDESMKVIGFEEKTEQPVSVPGKDTHSLASMGNYIFNTDFLFEQLKKDASRSDSHRDFGKDIIPAIIKDFNVQAFPFRGLSGNDIPYWRDVGTLDSFWLANMELLDVTPALNMYDSRWPIWTYQAQLPPAKFVFHEHDRTGMAVNSMVSGGCIISGSTVNHSLLFNNVEVCSYSEVMDSVVLPDVTILRNCKIKKAIIDRGCVIPDGTVIGHDNDHDRERGFRVTESGVVLVTRAMLGLPVGYE